MLEYVYIFLSACLLSLFLTPIFKNLSHRLNLLDRPNHRKIHKKPIPLLGGAAIFISFAMTAIVFQYLEKDNFWIILFGFIFVLFGLIDDSGRQIRARVKIWSHLLFSFLFVYLSGLSLNFSPNIYINMIISACFITFMTNSFNMLDGMDGLVSGLSVLASFFFLILALNSNQPEVVVLSLIIMGACLGFLKYNFNPAQIFLGENGSTFLGYIFAVLSIKLNLLSLWKVALALRIPRVQVLSFIVPLIILGIPIFDTFFVFANRFLNNLKMSTPGKDHSHHRIHLMGFSQKATVLTLYAVQIVLGAIALTFINANLQQFLAMLSIVFVLAIFFWYFLTQVKVYENR